MMLENNIQIRNTPALVEVNFDALKQRLEEQLQRYEIVVTADTVADAKKLATELNATRKVIDDRRKAEVAKASEPIKLFDEQMKELVMLCAYGRQKILDQVTHFEDETREICGGLLVDLRLELWQKHEVEVEFQEAQIEDLKKISNITAKQSLTKSTRDELERRVLANKAMQDLIRIRLLRLENECYTAGLKAPLQRQHVESFLFADKEIYEPRLAQLISVEIERQMQAEQRLRKDFEKERAVAQATAPATPPPAPATSAIRTEPASPGFSAARGKAVFTVSCTFVFEASEMLKDADIAQELRRVMEKAGVTSLNSVHVERARGAA